MRNLIAICIRNRVVVLALGWLVMVVGYLSYRDLPIDAFPDVSPALVQVFTETDGLAPEEVEQYVTSPIEVALAGLPDVEKIRSVSNFGLSIVNVYFEDDVDIYFARQLVSSRLQSEAGKIPSQFGHSELGPIATGMGLILYYYLDDPSGSHGLEELRTLQDWFVKPRLMSVSGVTEVLGIGGHEKQFHVSVNPEKLLQHDISILELVDRLEQNNGNTGAQFIEQNSEEVVVRSIGLATSKDDLESIVLKSYQGRPTYVRDVAEVTVGGGIRRGLQSLDGEREVVAGMVVKLFGQNSAGVIDSVEAEIEALNKSLPGEVKLVPYYEQRSLVEACLDTVRSALVQGAAAVAVVIFLFMGGWRSGLVIVLSLPFAVLFATFWMSYFGISANLMSLGGLAIAVGMLVDGAIVIVENVDRRLSSAEESTPRMQIIADACSEVTRPIFFATLIIIAAFSPLFGLEGVEGKTFTPLAYTVALGLAGALTFTLLLAPALISWLLKPEAKTQRRLVAGLSRAYETVLSVVFQRRWIAGASGFSLILVGALIFPNLGSEFTPRLQEGTLIVRVTMSPSSALSESYRTTQIVERRLMEIEEVTGVVSRIGRGEVGAHADPINSAEILVLLSPREEWTTATSQEELEDMIRRRLGRVPGAVINFTQPIAMSVDELLEGTQAELAIKIFGENVDLLKKQAKEISNAISEVRGAADVQVDQISGTPQLVIRIDRESVGRHGINVKDVQRTISASVGGRVAGQVFEGIKRFDILVRLDSAYRETPDSIGRLLIDAPNGYRVPLSDLASLEKVVGPRQIKREDGQRFIVVQCNVSGRDIGGFVKEAQAVVDRQVAMEPGYRVTWGGQFRLQEQANKRLALTIPLTLFMVLVLLYSAFESGRSVLAILSNIPPALTGGVVALSLSGQSLSVPTSVGFIALFGIALGNGMVLVAAINRLIEQGVSRRKACIDGSSSRLRAVLMTASTTALGLSPLLLSAGVGSEVQRPLATVVVGGLLTATLVTLFVLPVLYEWLLGWGEEHHPQQSRSGDSEAKSPIIQSGEPSQFSA
ncbi:MAG TPA: efflux RND transporter permease subunit [Myxococcales bacterium]|nr:efflux RND transporter permease subunit [Myxococcales bacterium]